MKIIDSPQRQDWADLCKRTADTDPKISESVLQILEKVRAQGDLAVRNYSQELDGYAENDFRVSRAELENSEKEVSEELKSAIQMASDNIFRFHRSQQVTEERVETTRGVECWRENRAIQKVGLYIPGGTAPLFSTVLMLAIPAKIAGCEEIVLCTPPGRSGKIAPEILYTAKLLGLSQIYKVGGAQAVGAMAYGTETVPKVFKIFGPGNSYVTKAKQLVQMQGTAIDMPAGPSEVLVIANEESDPAFVTSDLLAQAEHGPDSQVVLLCLSKNFADRVQVELDLQLKELPRSEVALQALEGSFTVVTKNLAQAIEFSNVYAPEHLILSFENAESVLHLIENAGSVFIGPYTCESLGDYASGTNHTLPTSAFARNYSGVSLDSFTKKISFQRATAEGIKNIGPAVEIMAEAEQLMAHKKAVTLRLKKLAAEENPENEKAR